MKKNLGILIGFVILLVVAVASYRVFCTKTYGEKLSYSEIRNYDIRRDIPLEDGVNYFIVENQGEFEYLFDFVSEDSNDRPAQIDFEKELVIALVYHNVDPRTATRINRVTLKDGNLVVDYRAYDSKLNIAVATQEKTFDRIEQKTKNSQTGEAENFYVDITDIIAVEMPLYYLDLRIFENGKPWPKIALGRRRLGSPETYEQFIENYLGTFTGILPCADCSGIETELTLDKNHYYTLKSTYMEKNSTPFIERGQWDISEDLAIIGLFDSKSKSQTYYQIEDKDNLERLDENAKRINTDFNITLTKDKEVK